MQPAWENVETLDAIVSAATEICEKDAQYNLLLQYEMPISVINSAFVKANQDEALKWMSEEVPNDLHFTHGQYSKGEEGIQHVIKELKSKQSSRRALLSLINMKNIIGSGDKAMPAFLILQFGIDQDALMVTAYFRALEVGSHLRINLAEVCLHCQRILKEFSRVQKLRLFLVAFRAYYDESYNCLKKSTLDQVKEAEVGIYVDREDIPRIRQWLESKKVTETHILAEGLEAMVTAVKIAGNKYRPAFLSNLQLALLHLKQLKKLREQYFEGKRLEEETREYLDRLNEALRELRIS